MEGLKSTDRGVTGRGDRMSRWGKIEQIATYQGEDALARYHTLLGRLMVTPEAITLERRNVRNDSGTLLSDQRVIALGETSGGNLQLRAEVTNEVSGGSTFHEEAIVGYCGDDIVVGVEYNGNQEPPVVNLYDLAADTPFYSPGRDAALAAASQLMQ